MSKVKSKTLKVLACVVSALILMTGFVGATRSVRADDPAEVTLDNSIHFTASGGFDFSVRYKNPITLAAGESVEIVYTTTPASGLFFMPSFNAKSYYDNNDANKTGGIKINTRAGLFVSNLSLPFAETPTVLCCESWGVPQAYTETLSALQVGNDRNPSTPGAISTWGESGTAIHDNGTWQYSSPLVFKAVFGADGSAYYCLQTEGDGDKWMTVCYVKSGIDITDAAHGVETWGYNTVDHPTIQAWGEEPTYQSVGFPSVEGVEAYPAITYTVLGNAFDVYGITLTKIAAGGERTVISSDCGDWFGVNLDSRVIRGNLPQLDVVDTATVASAAGVKQLKVKSEVNKTWFDWFKNNDEHVRINKTGLLAIPSGEYDGNLKLGNADAIDVDTTALWTDYGGTKRAEYVAEITDGEFAAGFVVRPYVVYTDIDENTEYTAYVAPAETEKLYEISFKNYDGTVLETSFVKEGETPVYGGATPTRNVEGYTYTFSGWDNTIVPATAAAEYVATYDGSMNEYSFTIERFDGTEEVVSFNVENRAAKLAAITLTADTVQYSYGWQTALPAVLALNNDQVFTEIRSTRRYTVTWQNYDGTVLSAGDVEYGTVPVYGGATPVKPATTDYVYTFRGWDKEVVAVVGAVTYVAEFDSAIADGIKFASLSLEGDIGINLYVYVSNADTLTANGGKLVGEKAIKDAVEYFRFTVRVAAKDYRKSVTLSVDGYEISGSYSVETYINAITSENEAYALVQSLKTYCEAARAFFAGETVDAAEAVSIGDNFEVSITGSDDDVTLVGATLILESVTTVNVYFRIDSLGAKVFKVGDDTVVPKKVDGTDDLYVISVDNIVAKDLGKTYSVTVGGYTVGYSALSYAYAVLGNAGSGTAISNVVKALYNYSVQAVAYFD